MRKVTKTYCIREEYIFSEAFCFPIPLTFSNCKNSTGKLTYNSLPYTAPTTEMFTPETSRNRKYRLK